MFIENPIIMINKYCGTLFLIMLTLLIMGSMLALDGNYWGLIPFSLAGLIASGFTTLKDSPREVGVISFLGARTDIMIDGKGPLKGLVLLFKPLGLIIVDIIRFEAKQHDHDIPISSLRCSINGVVTGSVSITFTPDTSNAFSLGFYDDAGREKGVREQLNEITISNLQDIVKDSPVDDVVSQTSKLGKELLDRMEGIDDTIHSDDIRNMGIKIKKLVLKLSKDKKSEEADQRVQQSKAMQTRIEERLKFTKNSGAISAAQLLNPDTVKEILDQIRKDLLEEDRSNDKLISETRGGRNLNINNADKHKGE